MKNSKTDTAWAKHALQEVALRATTARVAVLKLLASAESPMSHAEVVQALTEYGFDQSTLFRCLNEIADTGLVARLDLAGKARLFELRMTVDDVDPNHAHFICIDCGELTCMKDFSVEVTPAPGLRRGKLGTITEIMIRGHCGACNSV